MMKAKYAVVVIAVLAAGALAVAVFSRSRTSEYRQNKWTRMIDTCTAVMNRVQYMPDQGIPTNVMIDCQGIGIFPSTISGGLGVGGQYGEGIILVRKEGYRGWSPPAVFTITGGSFGLQIGGQATDIILIFLDRRSIDAIVTEKIKLGADASVAAGPVGRSASASTDIRLKGGIFSYSMSRGLFAGAKLEGAIITPHWDGNRQLYGKDLSPEDILFKNKAVMPKAGRRLVRVLNCYNPIRYFLRKVFGLRCP